MERTGAHDFRGNQRDAERDDGFDRFLRNVHETERRQRERDRVRDGKCSVFAVLPGYGAGTAVGCAARNGLARHRSGRCRASPDRRSRRGGAGAGGGGGRARGW